MSSEPLFRSHGGLYLLPTESFVSFPSADPGAFHQNDKFLFWYAQLLRLCFFVPAVGSLPVCRSLFASLSLNCMLAET